MHRVCDPIRDLAFDYRSGSLSDVEARRVDAHLDSCQACADYFSRVATLLEAPNTVAEEAEASIDADALFARITQQISGPAAAETMVFGETSEVTERFTAISEDQTFQLSADEIAARGTAPEETATEWADDTPASDNTDWQTARRTGWFVAAIAAIFAAALGFGLLRETQSNGSGDLPVLADSARIELPSLSAPAPSIELRGTADARWSLDESGEEARVLRIDAGAVLVEYVPTDERGLRVVAPSTEFDVIGTVFYVDAREPETKVGVLTGAVQVDGQTIAGGEVRDDGGVRSLNASDNAEWQGHVDVAMHEVRLVASAARRESITLLDPALTATDAPEREQELENAAATPPVAEHIPRAEPERSVERNEPSEELRPEPVPEPVDLREEAELAMAQRRWQDAANAYESLIRAGDGSSGTRLDLARLYLRQLDMPDRALPHLRRFVQDNPSDPVGDSARGELCRISEIRGMQEPLCAP